MNNFGNWIETIDDLRESFQQALPYSHVVIDNFFSEEYSKKLHDAFPSPSDQWIRYWNPIEKKFAMNRFEDHPSYHDLFAFMQTDEFVTTMKQITGISNLEKDPHLHGAGIHFHPKGGKLDMHLDYSIHPITKKERRVNLIIYMNQDWKESYHGDLQLWDKEFTEPKQRIYPVFNRAVLFQTNDISYHGMPQMVDCPEGQGRKSIAIYYVSEPTNVGEVRLKAHFRPLPTQPINKSLQRLYDIRNTKTINTEILQDVYSNWETDGNGYW
jgi:Rps23 Pro-64 3,4-dihydroxylase Tpa1-like proline 4-hydroxylase